MKNIFLVLIAFRLNIYALSQCIMKTEYKNATVTEIAKTVIDYENYARTIDITFTAKYLSTTSAANDRMSCTATTYGDTFSNKTIGSYSDMRDRYLTLMNVNFSNIVDDDGFKKWQQDSYMNYNSAGILHEKVFTFKTNIQQCEIGYTLAASGKCEKTISYVYKNMTCDANDKNKQGYGWELKNLLTNDGVKIDPDTTKNNSSTLDDTISSHSSSTNLCKREYQECTIDCVLPLTLDTTNGKCIMDYDTACQNRDMQYNSTLNICEQVNQCGTTEAIKDLTSDYCAMIANCNVVDGKCTQDSLKNCSDNTFSFNDESKLCQRNIGCKDNQIMLDNGKCGSIAYCNEEDTTTIDDCIQIKKVQKSCSPDDRDANLCFVSQEGPENFNIDTYRELIRVDINGTYKKLEYGDLKTTYCNNDDGNCTFRLVKMYAQNNGKELCFIDNVGTNGCIEISGECTIDGSIEFPQGIRQLFIENNNQDIVAYNKAIQDNSIGLLHSSCTLSGKVGHINSTSNHREIIAASSDGIDIKFWDSYKRGNIGLITFLPTISQQDLDDGYTYKEPEIMQLYRDNFTAFYSINNNTYAVYNGLISKLDCQTKIDGTSFYIPQAQNDDEMKILNMLSFLGDNQYNYNNADDTNGSCVIKSSSALSFNSQYYSMKRVSVINSQTKYVCSPLQCNNHSCQYNQCPTGFSGNIFAEEDFNLFQKNNYNQLEKEDICIDEICDSNKPYYSYCGNKFGCNSQGDIYQQEDGGCLQIECQDNEEFDRETNKCKKLGCKNSIEKDGKCIKVLEL